MDVLGSIDPFIQFSLSSDSRQHLTIYGPKLQTSIKKNAPYRAEWNESFLFGIDEPVSLNLELMDWDRTGTEKVGEALASIDEVFKLMQSRMGIETTLSLPVLNDGKPVLGRDNIPCCLNAKLRIVQDERKNHPAETEEELNDSQVCGHAVSASMRRSFDVDACRMEKNQGRNRRWRPYSSGQAASSTSHSSVRLTSLKWVRHSTCGPQKHPPALLGCCSF
jgi:hypothetical protein